MGFFREVTGSQWANGIFSCHREKYETTRRQNEAEGRDLKEAPEFTDQGYIVARLVGRWFEKAHHVV